MQLEASLRRLVRIQTIVLWTAIAVLCLALLWALRPRHSPLEAVHAPQVLEALAVRIWLTEVLGAPSDIPTRNTRPCAAWEPFTDKLGQPPGDLISAMSTTVEGQPAWTIECRPVRQRTPAAGGPRVIRLEFAGPVETATLCKALRETIAIADLPPRYELTPRAVDILARHYALPQPVRGVAPRAPLVGELRLDRSRQRIATIAALERVRRHLDGDVACLRDGHATLVDIPLGYRFDRHWYDWW